LFLYTKIIDWSNQNIEEIIDDILHDKYKQNIKKYYNRIYTEATNMKKQKNKKQKIKV